MRTSVSKQNRQETRLGRSMIGYVRRNINESYYRRDAFRKIYLQEPDGCVPEELIGDDVLYDVKSKFYWPVDAVREQLEKEFGRKRMMWVYVDPSYDDSTTALLTLDNEYVLFTYCAKAWNFWWQNEKEMERELVDWHTVARKRYRAFAEVRKR